MPFDIYNSGMETLKEYIDRHESNEEKSQSFITYLNYLIKNHGYHDREPDLYNKANISKQLWHSIFSGKSKPSLASSLKIVFALELSNRECKLLLKKAGITLSSSSRLSLIIRYCLENKIYDLIEVNNYLEQYGYTWFK